MEMPKEPWTGVSAKHKHKNDLFLSKNLKVATGDCPGQSAQVK